MPRDKIPDGFSVQHASKMVWWGFFRKFFDCQEEVHLTKFEIDALLDVVESYFGAKVRQALWARFNLLKGSKDTYYANGSLTEAFVDATKEE